MVYDSITKTPLESFVIGVDFSNVLDGETIVSANSSYIISPIGVSPAANDIPVQPDTITVTSDSKTLLGRISGGIDGREYKARFLAYTTKNNIYEHDVRIKVVE